MFAASLLLLAALPALAGVGWVGGSVVSVTEDWAGGSVLSVTEGGARGPAFAPRQTLALVAAAGQDAALDCRVLRLADKAVSWVRSRDLQILTHAGNVFTADARVSAAESAGGTGGTAAGGTRHTLRIQRLRVSDSGRYECQVNTEPKLSLLFNLTVLDEPVPRVVVTAASHSVTARAGDAATLACQAHYEPPPRALPLPPLDVRWSRGDTPLSLQSRSGGVSLDTERWAARVVSRLTLGGLRPEDAGFYWCAAGDQADSVRLTLVDTDERMEMQRDQAGSGARRAVGGRPLVVLSGLLAGLLRLIGS